jgi:hypothetical protein
VVIRTPAYSVSLRNRGRESIEGGGGGGGWGIGGGGDQCQYQS